MLEMLRRRTDGAFWPDTVQRRRFMTPLVSRPSAAGRPHCPFVGRLFPVASFLLVVLVLAFPATASAHTSKASRRDIPAMSSKSCLYITLWERTDVPTTGNGAAFNIDVTNKCGFPVRRIVARYRLTQLGCGDLGTGNHAGNFPVPNLAPGQTLTDSLLFTSYCIACSNGVIIGYPPFAIDVEIVAAAGFDARNPSVVATLNPNSKHEDTAILLNERHNPGPLTCFGVV